MEEDLAANHPDIKLVDTVYGDDDDQTSFDKTAALLQSHPDLKGIISPTTVGIAAAARYLSTSEYKGKVALTGLGTPNQMREYVKDGTVTEFALWNPEDLGYLAAYAADALVTGEIAILSAAANATNQNAWIKLMKADLAKNHPNVKLDSVVYGNDDDQTSFDKTAALLQSYPNLKAIISPTTVGIAAAARYISTSNYKGKVAVTGLGTPNQMRKYVKDGTVQEFALWNPEDLGYLAAYAAKALVDKQITGKQGDTFTAGKLGKYTVGANGTVLLGDPFVFTKANIGKFNF